MRGLMAVLVLLAGTCALQAVADAQSGTANAQSGRQKSIAKSDPSKARSRPKAKPRLSEREQRECANAEWDDPAGEFKSFPCWARSAFGSGRQISD